MRRWRVPDGSVLVELTEGAARRLLRLSTDAQAVHTYAPGSYAHEDDLYQHRFIVQDAQLLRSWSIQGPGGTKTGADVVLDGLCALPQAASPTPGEVRQPMLAHRQRAVASEASRQERISALARPPSGTPACSQQQRQRQRLAARVVHHADGLSSAALTLLNALAALPGPDADVDAASVLLVEACAFVTFDPQRAAPRATAPQDASVRAPAVPAGAAVQAVLGELGALRKALLDAADVQERVDATRNAACYRQAAGLVEAARARLVEAGSV